MSASVNFTFSTALVHIYQYSDFTSLQRKIFIGIFQDIFFLFFFMFQGFHRAVLLHDSKTAWWNPARENLTPRRQDKVSHAPACRRFPTGCWARPAASGCRRRRAARPPSWGRRPPRWCRWRWAGWCGCRSPAPGQWGAQSGGGVTLVEFSQ